MRKGGRVKKREVQGGSFGVRREKKRKRERSPQSA
jgi:hypothetical protein